MLVIALNGPAGAGKSTVAEILVTEHGFEAVAFAEPLYAGLSAMLDIDQEDLERRDTKERPIDWLGKSPRELLQQLGTAWGRERIHPEIWIRVMARRLRMLRQGGVDLSRLVITDVRFTNEAQFVKEQFGVIWHVARQVETTRPHVSEAGIGAHWIDDVIPNNGTLEELQGVVTRRLERLIEARTEQGLL